MPKTQTPAAPSSIAAKSDQYNLKEEFDRRDSPDKQTDIPHYTPHIQPDFPTSMCKHPRIHTCH